MTQAGRTISGAGSGYRVCDARTSVGMKVEMEIPGQQLFGMAWTVIGKRRAALDGLRQRRW
jgi:hypothetical protein